jgi:hypothetical protein
MIEEEAGLPVRIHGVYFKGYRGKEFRAQPL